MKKLVFVMPLMAISLVGCNKGGGDDPGPTPEPTYTITFDCQQCRAFNEDDKEVTSVTVPAVDPSHNLYKKFYFTGKGIFKTPLKSSITVKKTGTEEKVDYEYANGKVFIPIVGDLTVTAYGTSFSKSLENSSWDEIAEIAETGRANEFFEVGNDKTVTLKENGFDQAFAHRVRIIDFNKDKDPEGNDIGITFEFADVITKGTTTPTERYGTVWNGVKYVSGDNYDYRGSVINGALNDKTVGVDSVINRLPEDLEKVIKPVDKKVGVSTDEGQNYTATSFDGEDYPYPYLFPLAHDEITADSSTEITPDEGDIYQYYKEHKEDEDRIKKIVEYTQDSGEFYWLRSPYTLVGDMYNDAWNCFPTGAIGNSFVYYERAIAPAFCI